MGLITVTDIVEECSSYESGVKVYEAVKAQLAAGEQVSLSFKGISSVSTSFVNAAFIDLLQDFTFETIKSRLRFVDTNRAINDGIKRRFTFEVDRMKRAVA